MRSRLYIFSSRLIKSAFFWTVLIVLVIEGLASRRYPLQFVSHVVDERLLALDTQHFNASVLFLGDSVGHQVGAVLEKKYPGQVVSLACNAMVESTGQYYLFQRYMARNPAPKAIVWVTGNPIRGNLNGTFTENYVQRCFLNWNEIVGISRMRSSPVFSATMLAYKLFPSLRFRTHLQTRIPGLAQTGMGSASNQDETPAQRPPDYGLVPLLSGMICPTNGRPEIAQHYFIKLAQEANQRGIPLIVALRPIPESKRSVYAPDREHGVFMNRLTSVAGPLSGTTVIPPTFCPDDWFEDSIHLKPTHLEDGAALFTALIESNL